MNGYKITVWADNKQTRIIMEAQFPEEMIYHANTVYNLLYKTYQNIMMERVELVSTVYAIQVDGKTRKEL
jgi:hypothetical protein